jgi:hypothetical protein
MTTAKIEEFLEKKSRGQQMTDFPFFNEIFFVKKFFAPHFSQSTLI